MKSECTCAGVGWHGDTWQRGGFVHSRGKPHYDYHCPRSRKSLFGQRPYIARPHLSVQTPHWSYSRLLRKEPGYDQWEGDFQDMLASLRCGYEGTLRHETIRKQVSLQKNSRRSLFWQKKNPQNRHSFSGPILSPRQPFKRGFSLTMTRQSYGASGVGIHVGRAHGWSVFTHFPAHIGGPNPQTSAGSSV